MGAFEQMLARASLDDEYSWREVARTTLGMYLAVLALYRGRPRRRRLLLRPYEGLLDEVAELPPPVPPGARALTHVSLIKSVRRSLLDKQMK